MCRFIESPSRSRSLAATPLRRAFATPQRLTRYCRSPGTAIRSQRSDHRASCCRGSPSRLWRPAPRSAIGRAPDLAAGRDVAQANIQIIAKLRQRRHARVVWVTQSVGEDLRPARPIGRTPQFRHAVPAQTCLQTGKEGVERRALPCARGAEAIDVDLRQSAWVSAHSAPELCSGRAIRRRGVLRV